MIMPIAFQVAEQLNKRGWHIASIEAIPSKPGPQQYQVVATFKGNGHTVIVRTRFDSIKARALESEAPRGNV